LQKNPGVIVSTSNAAALKSICALLAQSSSDAFAFANAFQPAPVSNAVLNSHVAKQLLSVSINYSVDFVPSVLVFVAHALRNYVDVGFAGVLREFVVAALDVSVVVSMELDHVLGLYAVDLENQSRKYGIV